MGERRPLNVRVDEEVIQDFREYTQESKGKIRGEMGRLVENALIEYMDNDRSARIEEKVDALPEEIVGALLEELPERERRNTQTTNTTTNPGSQTEKRLQSIVTELPDNTAVSEAMLETPIENHAGSSPKTLDKYKRLLKKRGHVFEDPTEPDSFVTSRNKFAMMCENSSEVSIDFVDRIIGEYEDILGENWYLDALPDGYIRGNDLKVDSIMDTETYRRENGLLDGDRVGFQ